MGSCERGLAEDLTFVLGEGGEGNGERNGGVEDRRDEDLGKQIPSKDFAWRLGVLYTS